MLQGVVVGEIWSSVSVPGLASHKLLLVHSKQPSGAHQEIVAIDLVG